MSIDIDWEDCKKISTTGNIQIEKEIEDLDRSWYRSHECTRSKNLNKQLISIYNLDSVKKDPSNYIVIIGDYDSCNPVSNVGFDIQTSNITGNDEKENIECLLDQSKIVCEVLEKRLRYLKGVKC